MKKYIIALLIAAAIAAPALAGSWDVVEHLPSGLGASNMAVSRYYDASVGKDGIALVGGSTNSGDTSMAFFFNLADHGWTWLPNYPYAVSAAAAARAGDTLYVHGGWSAPTIKDSTFKYANVIYNWASTNMNSLTPRSYHGLVNLYNRYLYAVGGTNNLGQTTASVERLDPQGGPPIYVQSLPQSRTCAVTVTATGADAKPHIYVLGGKDSLGNILNSVAEYDSGSGWTTKATSMPVPRWQATGAVVNGLIYLIGGVVDGSNTITRRVDIYNPVTNTWMLGDSIPVKLFRAGACGVNNVIYLFGGSDTTLSQSDSVWLYRPLAPNPPQLILPAPDAQLNYPQVDFHWSSVPAVTQYRIQVSSDPTFTIIDVANSLTADTNSTSLAIYLGSMGDYFWRVKAYNWSLPDSSKWSPVRKLILDQNPPDAPIPSTPANDSILNVANVYFSWFAVDSVVAYNLQIDNFDGSFVTPIVNDSTIATTGVNIDLSAYGDDLFYWKVRARDAAGNWSGFFSLPKFTIDQTKPWVAYTEPSNGELSVAVGRDIVIGFSEPINYSIAGNFNFTCSPDPMGWFESWNTLGDTVTLSHNDFGGGQSVSFTVTNAKDMAGNNLTSSYAWNFNTESYDYTSPNITYVKCSDDPLYAGSSYSPFTVNASDDKKMGSVTVYWGIAGYSGYNFSRTLTEVSPGQYQTTINGYEIGIEGVQYQVEAVDSAGNTSYYPAMGDYYIHSVYMNGQMPATPFTYDKWQMISIPAYAIGSNIFGQLSNVLGPYDNTKWRLYEWAGGAYHEISTISTGSISELGRAYWLRRRTGPNNITFPGAISSYGDFNQSKPCSLDLYTGWNDLGTPFMFNINWMNVYIPDSVAGPYYYDGGRWLLPTEVTTNMNFASYQGFSFRNDNASPRKLEIYPVSAKKKDGKTAVAKSPDGWQVLVLVENEAGSDHNYFGLSSDASGQRDQYDYPEPPSGMTGTSGYFRLADDRFCTDIRPEIGDGQIWNFAVECNGATKLSVNLPAEFPAGTECYLADLARQVSVNVSRDRDYSFTPGPGELAREFRIIVGSDEYARQVLGRTFSVPAVTVLNQNTPNPFTDRTSISYELAAGGQVKIAVYNVTGQLIRTLLDEYQMTGRYNIGWDGKDQTGRKVAAGLYFCQLQAPGRSVTRRMALVR